MLVTTIIVYGFIYLKKKKRVMISSCMNENILSNVNMADHHKHYFLY